MRWLYRWVLGYRTLRYSPALDIGSLVHRGLESVYGAEAHGDVDVAVGTMRAYREENYPGADPGDAETAFAIAEGAVRGYWAVHGAKDAAWKVVAVEQGFWKPKGLPTAGRIDMVVEVGEQNGDDVRGLWLVEHKTAGSIDEDYVRELSMDPQVQDYILGARAAPWGKKVRGVIYNVIRKPSIRPKQGESLAAYQNRLVEDYQARPEFYFYRAYLRADLGVLKRQRGDVGMIQLEMSIDRQRWASRQLPPFRHVSKLTCRGCDFLVPCRDAAGLDGETPAGFERERRHS